MQIYHISLTCCSWLCPSRLSKHPSVNLSVAFWKCWCLFPLATLFWIILTCKARQQLKIGCLFNCHLLPIQSNWLLFLLTTQNLQHCLDTWRSKWFVGLPLSSPWFIERETERDGLEGACAKCNTQVMGVGKGKKTSPDDITALLSERAWQPPDFFVS